MEHYASKEDTLKALSKLGFTESSGAFAIFNSSKRKECNGVHSPVARLRMYQCASGYWCVEHVPGGWQAPVVWNGPKAEWDQVDPADEFANYLNKVAPGWR